MIKKIQWIRICDMKLKPYLEDLTLLTHLNACTTKNKVLIDDLSVHFKMLEKKHQTISKDLQRRETVGMIYNHFLEDRQGHGKKESGKPLT